MKATAFPERWKMNGGLAVHAAHRAGVSYHITACGGLFSPIRYGDVEMFSSEPVTCERCRKRLNLDDAETPTDAASPFGDCPDCGGDGKRWNHDEHHLEGCKTCDGTGKAPPKARTA